MRGVVADQFGVAFLERWRKHQRECCQGNIRRRPHLQRTGS